MTTPESTPVSAIDPLRLARAIQLDARHTGIDRYFVTGGAACHEVDLRAGVCDCTDSRVHGHQCKHLLLCRLREGDPEVIRALRQLVPMPERSRAVRAA